MKDIKKIKILLVLNELDWFWSHRLPLATAIIDKDWDLSLATHETSQETRLNDLGISGYDLPRIGRIINPISHLKFILAIHKTIKNSQPDLIHVITIRYAFYVGLVTSLTRYKPVVFTVAGLGSLFSSETLKMRVLRVVTRPLLKLAFDGAGKHVIFQNPDDRNAMLNAGIISASRTSLIRGSGVDLQEFPYLPYDDGRASTPMALFASRLLVDKGISDFIAASRLIKEKGINIDFIVAGDTISGNNRFIPEAEIERAQSAGNIQWLGKVSNVQELMQRSMIVVFPSYYGEGVPKVLLEAAATGRPIITCDVPGCREIVKHGQNGLLVPIKNPQALAQAIEELISDPAKRKAFGAAGRKFVEEDFHKDLVVQKTLKIYLNSMNKSQALE